MDAGIDRLEPTCGLLFITVHPTSLALAFFSLFLFVSLTAG